MTLDFPNNPSNGQKYPDPSIEGQPQWVYNNSEKVWKIQNPIGPVGPSGPAGPVGPVGPSGADGDDGDDGSGFAPIFKALPGGFWASPEHSYPAKGCAGSSLPNIIADPAMCDIFGSSGDIQFTLPPGANAAVVIIRTWANFLNRSGSKAVTGHGYAKINYRCRITTTNTAHWIKSAENGVDSIMHIDFYRSLNQGGGLESLRHSDSTQPVVISGLQMKGSNKTFRLKAKIDIEEYRQGLVAIAAGTVLVIPFNTSIQPWSSAAEVFGLDDQNPPLRPEYTLEDSELDKASALKDRMKHYLDNITYVLQYDSDLDTAHPGGRSVLSTQAGEILKLKRELSIGNVRSFEEMDLELDNIGTIISPYLAFSFEWQQTGTPFMI